MNSVALVFSQAPHGSAAGREGLDAALAISALTDQIGLFFIADGVFQLLPEQQPAHILARDYVATFGVLELYDIKQYYVCRHSLAERGISAEAPLVLAALPLLPAAFRQQLSIYDVILNF